MTALRWSSPVPYHSADKVKKSKVFDQVNQFPVPTQSHFNVHTTTYDRRYGYFV